MTIKYNDFKLTQNAESAEPQKWRQIFAEVRPNSPHVAEPNWAEHSAERRTSVHLYWTIRINETLAVTGVRMDVQNNNGRKHYGCCNVQTAEQSTNVLRQQVLNTHNSFLSYSCRNSISPSICQWWFMPKLFTTSKYVVYHTRVMFLVFLSRNFTVLSSAVHPKWGS